MRGPLVRNLVALATITLSATTSFAQNAAAEALFTDAERLLAEGKIGEACAAYEASNRIESRAGTLVNLGICRERNGQLASAWSAFKDALARVKDPKKRAIAEERVAAIEPRLSYLTISVPDESRVEGLVVTRNGAPVDMAIWNRALPVDGGAVTIEGKAPGHEAWSTTVEVPNELGKVSVEVPRFKELTRLVTPAAPPVTEPAPAVSADVPPPSMFTTKRKVAIGVAGVGAVALIGGVVFGAQAKGLEDDAFALCPDQSTPCTDGDRANDLISRGKSRAMLANVSLGVGAAAVIGGVVLWFVGAPVASRETSVSIIPSASATSAGLDLEVRF